MGLKDRKIPRKSWASSKKIRYNKDLYQQIESMITFMIRKRLIYNGNVVRMSTKDSPLGLSAPSLLQLDIGHCEGYLSIRKIT